MTNYKAEVEKILGTKVNVVASPGARRLGYKNHSFYSADQKNVDAILELLERVKRKSEIKGASDILSSLIVITRDKYERNGITVKELEKLYDKLQDDIKSLKQKKEGR